MKTSTLLGLCLTTALISHSARAGETHTAKLVPDTRTMFLPAFYVLNKCLPVGDTIIFNRTYLMPGVAVEYKYDIHIGELHYSSTGGDLRCSIPESAVGKVATMIVSLRKNGEMQFTAAESLQVNVTPRALFSIIPNATVHVGTPLRMVLTQGINPQALLEQGTVVHIVDDHGGAFFKSDIRVRGAEMDVPMQPGAKVSSPTTVLVKISTDNAGQLDDDEVLTIVPNVSPKPPDHSIADLESLPLKALPYEKAVIGVLSKDECGMLARGLQSFLHHVRRPAGADSTITISIKEATCEATLTHGEMKIVRLFMTTCIATPIIETVLDKKSGETVARQIVSETRVEDTDLRGADLTSALQTKLPQGPFAGKTLGEALRLCENLK